MAAFIPNKSFRRHIPVKEHPDTGELVYRFNKQGTPPEVYHQLASMMSYWAAKHSADYQGNLEIQSAIDEVISFLNSL